MTKAQHVLLTRLASLPDGTTKLHGGTMVRADGWSRSCIAKLRELGYVTMVPGREGVAPTITITAAGRAALAAEGVPQ